jgi:hypothetical protein
VTEARNAGVQQDESAHEFGRAAMALVKVACSVCACEGLGQYQRAIDWLMGRVGVRF